MNCLWNCVRMTIQRIMQSQLSNGTVCVNHELCKKFSYTKWKIIKSVFLDWDKKILIDYQMQIQYFYICITQWVCWTLQKFASKWLSKWSDNICKWKCGHWSSKYKDHLVIPFSPHNAKTYVSLNCWSKNHFSTIDCYGLPITVLAEKLCLCDLSFASETDWLLVALTHLVRMVTFVQSHNHECQWLRLMAQCWFTPHLEWLKETGIFLYENYA